jgi:hypothetical protein
MCEALIGNQKSVNAWVQKFTEKATSALSEQASLLAGTCQSTCVGADPKNPDYQKLVSDTCVQCIKDAGDRYKQVAKCGRCILKYKDETNPIPLIEKDCARNIVNDFKWIGIGVGILLIILFIVWMVLRYRKYHMLTQ